METDTIIQPRQFAFHDRVSKTAPQFDMWDEAVKATGELSREQKDRIFHSIQGNSGKEVYMRLGWKYPFGQWMKTYLVKYHFNGWQEIKAFDKTCIRNSWYTNRGIIEIIQKPE